MNSRQPDPSPRSSSAHLSAVEADLDLVQLSRGGRWFRSPPPVAAVLRWDPADPWAVELRLLGEVWLLGWELLASAVARGWAGVGDVGLALTARPVPALYVALRSPSGSATLRGEPWDGVAFVAAVGPRQARAVAAVRWPDTPAGLDAAINADRA